MAHKPASARGVAKHAAQAYCQHFGWNRGHRVHVFARDGADFGARLVVKRQDGTELTIATGFGATRMIALEDLTTQLVQFIEASPAHAEEDARAAAKFITEGARAILEAIFGRKAPVAPAPPPPPPATWREDFRTLGLATARVFPPTEAELRRAWRQTALKVHPDRGGSAEGFARAREAYERVAASLGVKP